MSRATTPHVRPKPREIRIVNPFQRKTKYHSKQVEFDGRVYASKAEAAKAAELDFLKRAGQIRHWEAQPRFRLGCAENRCLCDFLVWRLDGTTYAIDVKGYQTDSFKRVVRLWRRYGPCELHVVSRKNSEIIRPEWMGD